MYYDERFSRYCIHVDLTAQKAKRSEKRITAAAGHTPPARVVSHTTAATMATAEERALMGMLPYTALTIIVTLMAVGKNVTLRLMGSLTYYLIPETPQEQARARLARVTAGKSPSETRRRAARIKANISEDAEGTESIAAVKFGKALVLAPYFREFDYGLLFAILVIANFAAAELAPMALNLPDHENILVPMLALVAVFSSARSLVKLLFDKLTPKIERQAALAVGVVGFVLALFFLLLVPTSALDFEVAGTSKELAPAMAKKIRSRVVGRKAAERVADVAGQMVVPELQIFIGLALFAGIISGALFGPAVRIVRCYNTCVRPPSWGGDFVGVSKAVVPLLHASFALPIVTAFAWFAPLSRGPFGLTDEQYDLLRVVSLMVTGLVQVAVVPALVQAYLDGGMVAWYEVKHGERGVQAMAALRGVVRQKLEVTRHLACKVALQAVGPATLMIAYACLLGCKRRDESDGATENITSLVPAVCWRTIASFLGWWTCAVWATLTSAGVAAAKAGVETFTR